MFEWYATPSHNCHIHIRRLYVSLTFLRLRIFKLLKVFILYCIHSGQVLGRRVLPVKICSCPKRDMDREEKDTRLQKNTVFRRTKKCISQDHRHSNNHHHRNENDHPPHKIIKIESSGTTESETENMNNNTYTLPVSFHFYLNFNCLKLIMIFSLTTQPIKKSIIKKFWKVYVLQLLVCHRSIILKIRNL